MDDSITQLEVEGNNSNKYEIEKIQDSTVYARKLKGHHLLGFDYLVSWKCYFKEKNTWDLMSMV